MMAETMVDRAARDKAARLLSLLCQGALAQEHFAAEWPHQSADPALWQIFQTVWSLFEAHQTQQFDPQHPLAPGEEELLQRSVLFLLSNEVYAFDPVNAVSRMFWGVIVTIICAAAFMTFWGQGLLPITLSLVLFAGVWVTIITLMHSSSQPQGQHGEGEQYWPFASRLSYEQAKLAAATIN